MAIAINLGKCVIVIALATKVFSFCKNGWTLMHKFANHDQQLPTFH